MTNVVVILSLSCLFILQWQEQVLESVRDALVSAYFYNCISEDEFVLLYDANRSKPLYPYWKFDNFDLNNWDEDECFAELRVFKSELPALMDCFGIPEKIVCSAFAVIWKADV